MFRSIYKSIYTHKVISGVISVIIIMVHVVLQIYRDFQMISDGTGLKLHYIDKIVLENEGKSVKKFGMCLYCIE